MQVPPLAFQALTFPLRVILLLDKLWEYGAFGRALVLYAANPTLFIDEFKTISMNCFVAFFDSSILFSGAPPQDKHFV